MANGAKLVLGGLVMLVLFAIATTWSNQNSVANGPLSGMSAPMVAGTTTAAASLPNY